MLYIATMLGIGSPFVLEHQFTLVFRFWLRTALHFALAIVIATMVYGLILLAVTETYRPHGPMATVLYGIGLALAGLLAICGGTMAAPDRLAKVTFLATSSLAVVLPIGLYVQMAVASELRPGYLWYLVAGFAGSVAATRLMPWVRIVPRLSGI